MPKPQQGDMEAENRTPRGEMTGVRERRDIFKTLVILSEARAVRYERIEAMKDEHSLAALCAALGVSRACYYR